METVLITGCSSGIGRATALAFLEADWRVYATARDPSDIDDLADAGCDRAALDVTDDDQVSDVVDRVVDEAGRIDCLVNNAGYGKYGPLEDVGMEDLHEQFDVNVYGPHRLARAALPHMREREDGTIVNVSSFFGRLSTPMAGAYAGSKFALEAMSDALRGEVSGFGVDVVVVEPGPVSTNFVERADREIESDDARTGAYSRLYRAYEDVRVLGDDGPLVDDPSDVANVILNAASCTDPAPRYAVGPIARFLITARHLPDRWRDRAARLATKLVR